MSRIKAKRVMWLCKGNGNVNLCVQKKRGRGRGRELLLLLSRWWLFRGEREKGRVYLRLKGTGGS
jgi:hypothetical protein